MASCRKERGKVSGPVELLNNHRFIWQSISEYLTQTSYEKYIHEIVIHHKILAFSIDRIHFILPIHLTLTCEIVKFV